jgi:hypothetical protein
MTYKLISEGLSVRFGKVSSDGRIIEQCLSEGHVFLVDPTRHYLIVTNTSENDVVIKTSGQCNNGCLNIKSKKITLISIAKLLLSNYKMEVYCLNLETKSLKDTYYIRLWNLISSLRRLNSVSMFAYTISDLFHFTLYDDNTGHKLQEQFLNGKKYHIIPKNASTITIKNTVDLRFLKHKKVDGLYIIGINNKEFAIPVLSSNTGPSTIIRKIENPLFEQYHKRQKLHSKMFKTNIVNVNIKFSPIVFDSIVYGLQPTDITLLKQFAHPERARISSANYVYNVVTGIVVASTNILFVDTDTFEYMKEIYSMSSEAYTNMF